MRILVITREFPPYIRGGISYHLKYLYEELLKNGHDISVISGRLYGEEPNRPLDMAQEIDVHWAPYISTSAQHLQFPASLWRKLNQFDISTFDIAIAHTDFPFSLDVPVVTKIHDAKQEERKYMDKNMGSVKRIISKCINPSRRWVESRSVNNCDFVIFNSELTRDVWESNYDINTDSTVIYNGVDILKFSPNDNDPVGYRFLLYVGGGGIRKGLQQIKIFAEESPYPIMIAGETDPDVPNTEYLGVLSHDELVNYYSAAHATVHPAKFEAFGNIILESLACGTPVIASNRCGASEILTPSCGVVTNDLSDGLDKLAETDPDVCRERAKEFTWESVASQTEEILSHVV